MEWNLTTQLSVMMQLVLWSCVSSQIVMRLADGSPDEYRYVNDSCDSLKCSPGSYDYRPDHSCGRCKCWTSRPTFSTESKSCERSDLFLSGRWLTFDGHKRKTISVVSSKTLRNGINILGCPSLSQPCHSFTTQCEIETNATVYDNQGPKSLWPTKTEVDFEIIESKETSDSLKWNVKDCDSNKYDGLLIKVVLSCNIGKKEVNSSFIVFKIPGIFKVGTNPSTRGKCKPPPTTTPPTTKSAKTTGKIQTPNGTSTAATTTNVTATMATNTSTTVTEKSNVATTMATKTATITEESNATTTAAKLITHSTSSTRGSITSSPDTTTNKTTTTESTINSTVKFDRSTLLIYTSSPTTKRTISAHVNSTVPGPKTKPITRSSKKIIMIAASVSSAALLIIIIIIVVVACSMSKRRRFSSVHNVKRLDDRKANRISDHFPSERSFSLPSPREDQPGTEYWTIGADGKWMLTGPAHSSSGHSGQNSDELEEDIYAEPNVRKSSLIDKLYSKVDLNWKKHQKENDDGYASIDDISMSANARKSPSMSSHQNRLGVTGSTPITKQPQTTSKLRQDNRNEIFEMQNIGFQNSGFDWHDSDVDGLGSDISRTISDTSNILAGNVGVNPVYEDTEMLNGNDDSDDYSEPEYVVYEP
eukprot:Seg1800.4 transcript_id=Seg1800.4/GoldUCD/mRNA.D3Y31 product="hypothetical protein" protein_id=Seg1800.4/GoldUCD/D3Y31